MTAHERTGWRDEWPSRWHRQLGPDFPMCDVDALWFHHLQPVAIIDWKHHRAAWTTESGSHKAQANLAASVRTTQRPAGLPFFVVAYWPESHTFRPHAANGLALAALTATGPAEGDHHGLPFRTLTAAGFVDLAARVRGLPLTAAVKAIARLPAQATAGSSRLAAHPVNERNRRPA